MAPRAAVFATLALAVGTAGCQGGGHQLTRAASHAVPSTEPPQTTSAPPPTAPATTRLPPPAPTTALAPRTPLAGKVVVIDPGHNGANAAHPVEINQPVDAVTEKKPCDTTGTATNDGYAESAYNFDVAQRTAALLRADGAQVVLTRTTDAGWGPCITERAAIGNRAGAAVAVSIHADGGPAGGRGFHVIEPALIPGHTEAIVAPSQQLALDLRAVYQSGTGMPYATYIGHEGLDVRSDLGGLNLSKVPKVFIECGNMRNAADAPLLESAAFRARAARAIADGLERFLRGR